MASFEFVSKLFDYDTWANQETLASLSTVPGDAGGALKVYGHIIGAQRVWLARFENSHPSTVQPWPAMTFDECRAATDEFHKRWAAILNSLTPETLASDLVYRNTKGVEFKTPIQDILMHLVMHAAYHRGQVAAAVREAGGKPAVTDYVVYVRKKAEGRSK